MNTIFSISNIISPSSQVNHFRHLQSFHVCSQALQQILSHIFKHLPPHPQILLQYSGILLKQTTSKIVDVNMLQSQFIPLSSSTISSTQNILSPQKVLYSQIPLKLSLQNPNYQNSLNSQFNQWKNLNFQKQIQDNQIFKRSFKDQNDVNDLSNEQFIKQRYLKNQNQASQNFSNKIFELKKSHKLKQDQEIHLKHDGIKFIKKEQLKNLIKHRISNSHTSLHLPSSNALKSQKNQQHIKPIDINRKFIKNTVFTQIQKYTDEIKQANKPILNKKMINKMQLKNQQTNSGNLKKQKTQLNTVNKSSKSFSTLPGVNKHKNDGLNYQKDRISGVMNQTQFINLRDYYKQKYQIQKDQNSLKSKNGQKDMKFNPIKRITNSSVNPFSHSKKAPSNFSSMHNQNCYKDSQWLNQKQIQSFDQEDIIINKLRERKQKFYRTGINYSNGDSYVNTKRQNPLIASNQKGNSQNNQIGAMIAFDYSGQILPTFKYDMMKMQSHYQDMQFSINQNDESFVKKKQRKGHMFRGGINLKLVDHQRFIPHPNYKFEPLVQKPGMLMRQNTAYALKKGVEVRPKDENTNTQHNQTTQNQQNRERINKTAFQFLYNEQGGQNKVKYQDFVRFKKSAQSGSSQHKNLSSRKKLFDLTNHQRDESLLSKKSIAMKGLKNRQQNQQDGSNKVHKGENRKALEMLINATQNGNSELETHKQLKRQLNENGKDSQSNQNMGVLKKNSLHSHKKSLSNNLEKNGKDAMKKKVRIA